MPKIKTKNKIIILALFPSCIATYIFAGINEKEKEMDTHLKCIVGV